MYTAIKTIKDTMTIIVLSTIPSAIYAGVCQVTSGLYLFSLGVFVGSMIGHGSVFLFFYGAYRLDRARLEKDWRKQSSDLNN